MDAVQLAQVVDDLRRLGSDTQRVEAKSAGGGLPDSLAETICAFANDGGGTVILGLDEREGFTRTTGFNAGKVEQQLATMCAEAFDRPLRPLIDTIPFEGGAVVVATIDALEPREKPCYIAARGGVYQNAFIRTGDGDRRLTPYEVDQLRANSVQPRWDREAVPEARLEDLDARLLAGFLRTERQRHPRLDLDDDVKALRTLGVVASESECRRAGHVVPTLAGLLCFAVHPQQFFPQLMVSCTAHVGSTKGTMLGQRRFLDNATLLGPIPYLVEDAVAFVARNMRTGAVMKDSLRYDLPDYPLDAVREAVTNALMHRDYSPAARGAQVQVNLYVDRLEIQSPGGLYGSVTVDRLGQDGVSDSRNQHLARILEATPAENGGMVAENRGTGYASILSELQALHMPPPVPVDKIRYFRLTFPRRFLTEAELGAASGVSSREAIVHHLERVESASVRDLAAAAGVAVGTARRVLADLVDDGIVERTAPLTSPRQRYRLLRREGEGNGE